jgi:hypothetical protein
VPGVGPGERTSAVAWEIDRPRRSTLTSTVTGPEGTCPANTVVSDRRRWPGSASSTAIALAAIATIIPPWGTTGQFQRGSRSTW